MRVYLDNCCFNRPFDDQSQLRIRLETEAKLAVQDLIRSRKLELAWSYMLDFENSQNPYPHRLEAIGMWREIAAVQVVETPHVLHMARTFAASGLRAKDSIHLASAIEAQCSHLLTTDDQFLRNAVHADGIIICTPITFALELESQ